MGAAALAPLREDIAIFRGPVTLDGGPSWTLHDPARNRYFRLGWREFEILSRWQEGDAAAISRRLAVETPLQVDAGEVADLARFLLSQDLLRLSGPAATARLLEAKARAKQSPATWLLHHYLFVRVPLVRPDAVLDRLYPLVRPLYSRTFLALLAVLALAGFYLVARQWDAFIATFVDLMSVRGAVLFALTLAGLKAIHELGHAFTAKHAGCRVPTMGFAFLVLVPMLYTDVNDAWKLTARRARLAIGLAGVGAELACAVLALLAWSFLPPGPARSAAFLAATVTWVTTLLLNLSPFMRFDGYYVLSDWLEVPNLHARAFALARWRLRALLFGLDDPPPEDWPPPRRRLLIGFAVATWIYRFALFLGIAALLYHFTFKALGVALAAVEIGYFVIAPIVGETRLWWQRRREIGLNAHSLGTLVVLACLIGLLAIPWRGTVEAPAILRSRQKIDVFMPEFGARVVRVGLGDGLQVAKGATLVELESPDLAFKLDQAARQMATLEWQIGASGVDAGLLARSQVTEREYETARAEFAALQDRARQLTVVAPAAGTVRDVAEDLVPGAWLPGKLRLFTLVDPAAVLVEAYVAEADLDRVRVGDAATFFAEADSRREVALVIAEIAGAGSRSLTEPALASLHGGPIAVRPGRQNELLPEQTYYRITLNPAGAAPRFLRTERGTVLLRGEAVPLAVRIWRAVLAVLVRETGA